MRSPAGKPVMSNAENVLSRSSSFSGSLLIASVLFGSKIRAAKAISDTLQEGQDKIAGSLVLELYWSPTFRSFRNIRFHNYSEHLRYLQRFSELASRLASFKVDNESNAGATSVSYIGLSEPE